MKKTYILIAIFFIILIAIVSIAFHTAKIKNTTKNAVTPTPLQQVTKSITIITPSPTIDLNIQEKKELDLLQNRQELSLSDTSIKSKLIKLVPLNSETIYETAEYA